MGGHAQFIICKASVKFHLENPKFKLGGKQNYGRQRVAAAYRQDQTLIIYQQLVAAELSRQEVHTFVGEEFANSVRYLFFLVGLFFSVSVPQFVSSFTLLQFSVSFEIYRDVRNSCQGRKERIFCFSIIRLVDYATLKKLFVFILCCLK